MLPLRTLHLVPKLGALRGLSTSPVVRGGGHISQDASVFWGILKRDWMLVGVIAALASVVATTQYSVSVIIIFKKKEQVYIYNAHFNTFRCTFLP